MTAFSLTSQTAQPTKIMRQIAPGVWIEVRRSPRMIHPPELLNDVKHRISDVLATFTGRSSSVNVQDYIERSERRAA